MEANRPEKCHKRPAFELAKKKEPFCEKNIDSKNVTIHCIPSELTHLYRYLDKEHASYPCKHCLKIW